MPKTVALYRLLVHFEVVYESYCHAWSTWALAGIYEQNCKTQSAIGYTLNLRSHANFFSTLKITPY